MKYRQHHKNEMQFMLKFYLYMGLPLGITFFMIKYDRLLDKVLSILTFVGVSVVWFIIYAFRQRKRGD